MREAVVASDTGFPWATGMPTPRARVIVALTIAILAAVLHYARASEAAGHSDFSSLWYAARFLVEGSNPYEMIGPGKLVVLPSPPFYPAPAFVFVLPLTLLPLHLASTVFVAVSSYLLAWGCTSDGWHRLPLFPSIAFLTSAQLGQWSILFTAAVFIPAIAFAAAVKPQAALPVVLGSTRLGHLWAGLVGGLILGSLSFVLMPGWVTEWWRVVTSSDHFTPPILRFGGVAIGLVLLRWRRPEAWLVFVSACLPQTWYPYNGLILLTVASTYREASVLSLVSSAAWIVSALISSPDTRSDDARAVMGAMLIAGCYLPATIAILRRPNAGPVPFWMRWMGRQGPVYIAASGR
jgi:hypothetical protein